MSLAYSERSWGFPVSFSSMLSIYERKVNNLWMEIFFNENFFVATWWIRCVEWLSKNFSPLSCFSLLNLLAFGDRMKCSLTFGLDCTLFRDSIPAVIVVVFLICIEIVSVIDFVAFSTFVATSLVFTEFCLETGARVAAGWIVVNAVDFGFEATAVVSAFFHLVSTRGFTSLYTTPFLSFSTLSKNFIISYICTCGPCVYNK